MIFFDNEPYNQGYASYGDVDFFERGRLVREDSILDGYFVLYCEPDCSREDIYLFGRCYVDVTDNWLLELIPRLQYESDEEYAVRCIDELGAYEFGYDFPYPVSWYSRGEVLDALHDMSVSLCIGKFAALRSEESEELILAKRALEQLLDTGSMFMEAILSEELDGLYRKSRTAIGSLIGKELSEGAVSNTDCFNAALNTWLHSQMPLTYSGAADCLQVLSDLLADVISPDDRDILAEKADMFLDAQKKADNLSALSA